MEEQNPGPFFLGFGIAATLAQNQTLIKTVAGAALLRI